MIYHICKQIGAMACVLKGEVDAILLTGGLMRFDDISEKISERCGWIANIYVYPGEREQEALLTETRKVLRRQREAHKYTGVPVFRGFED